MSDWWHKHNNWALPAITIVVAVVIILSFNKQWVPRGGDGNLHRCGAGPIAYDC